MSGVLGGGKQKSPSYTGLQLNTSAYGLPRPVVYGQTRIAPNVIWYGNFTATQGKGSGKGGSGSTSGYTYSVDIALGLCEGPITGVQTVWQNGDKNVTNMATLVMNLALGGYGSTAQPTWGYLSSNYPNQAINYSGLSFVYTSNYQLGQTSALPNFGFEVQGLLYGTAPNGIDADPSQVIPDVLSNVNYGSGFPSARVGQLAAVAETHSVPSGSPYTVTTTATSVFNLDVVDASGNIYACVASGVTPGANQYSLSSTSGGLYTFGAASAGKSLTFRFASNVGLASYKNYALSQGLWISPAYTSQSAAASVVTDIATFTNSALVWSSGSLFVAPYGTVNTSGNGYSYTAPTAPLFALTDDDFLPNRGTKGSGSTDAPVVLSRTRPSDQYNDIQVEVLDRYNQYAATVIEVSDAAQMTRYGRRAQGTQTAHIFSDPTAGNVCAQLLLQQQYIRNTYSFTLDARYCVLDPMDIVSITDSALGLSGQWAQITEISENDDGTLSFTANEYPTGTGAAAAYTVNNGQAINVNQNDLAPAINTPIVFTPPIALCASNGLEVWAAVSGALTTGQTSTYGGCYIWLSYDGASYSQVLNFSATSRMGVTTSSLAATADPDTTHTVGVDLTESGGTLSGVSATEANALSTLCYLDGEYIAFQAATLTATNKYTLGTLLRRGLYGSAPAFHASGAAFCRLDPNIAKIPINSAQVGQTIYIIFQPYNLYGGGVQSLANLTPVTLSIGGAPNNFTVSSLYATVGIKSVNISWVNPSNAKTALAAVEIWRNTTNTTSGATHIGDAAFPAQTFTDNGLTTGVTYYYFLRCRDIAGNEGPWSSSISATPVVLTSTDIGAASVTAAAFVNGISPVPYGLLSALPSPSGYSGPPFYYATDTGNLYRYSSGAWTLNVPASVVGAGLTASQISSVNAAAVGTGLTASQIASVSGSVITAGTITGASIAGNTITGSNIVSGTITASNIAANTITASQIAAGTITATQISSSYIYTGTLNASQITAGTISASYIGAGTFTGSTFQTASSGARIVMSAASNQVLAYDSGSHNIASIGAPSSGAPLYSTIAGANPDGYSYCGGFATTITGVTPLLLSAAGSGQTALSVSNGNITIPASNGYLNSAGYNLIGGEASGSFFLGDASGACYVKAVGILPSSAGGAVCGSTTYPWLNGATQTAFTVTSDRRLKTKIAAEQLGLDFIRTLKPKTFELKSVPGKTRHGLVAQDLEEALAGRPFAGLVAPEGEDGYYGVIYEELIAPMLLSIQELDAKVTRMSAPPQSASPSSII
jgi:hypothetical protein